jgi:hypothetical protein
MTAIDSLEAAFAKEVLSISDTNYGFLLSIFGTGIVNGVEFSLIRFLSSVLLCVSSCYNEELKIIKTFLFERMPKEASAER